MFYPFKKKSQPIEILAYWLLLFMVIFIPFEDFLLKFLPVSDTVYFYTRFLSEIIGYTAFALVAIYKIIVGKGLFRTPLDTPIILLVLVVLISAVINDATIYQTLVNIRPVLRYVALFYLAVNINLTSVQVSTIINCCIYTGIAQFSIGLLQLITGGAINSFLEPKESNFELGGVSKNFVLLSGREIGSIYGAAGDTILFASFMIIFLILLTSKIYLNNNTFLKQHNSYLMQLVTRHKNAILWVLAIATMLIIGFTYARICMIVAFIILATYSLLKFANRRTMAIIIILLAATIPLIPVTFDLFPEAKEIEYTGNARFEEQSILEDTRSILTPEYIKVARQQRLGAVVDIPRTVIYNRPLFGYGPDQKQTIEGINNSKTDFLTRKWTTEAFEDVYWSAIMAYYGIFGLAAMIWLFYRIYKWARIIYRRTQNQVLKELSLAIITIILTTVLLLFFNQFIEFRIYGLYFWLLPGLAFNLYYQEKYDLVKKDRL